MRKEAYKYPKIGTYVGIIALLCSFSLEVLANSVCLDLLQKREYTDAEIRDIVPQYGKNKIAIEVIEKSFISQLEIKMGKSLKKVNIENIRDLLKKKRFPLNQGESQPLRSLNASISEVINSYIYYRFDTKRLGFYSDNNFDSNTQKELILYLIDISLLSFHQDNVEQHLKMLESIYFYSKIHSALKSKDSDEVVAHIKLWQENLIQEGSQPGLVARNFGKNLFDQMTKNTWGRTIEKQVELNKNLQLTDAAKTILGGIFSGKAGRKITLGKDAPVHALYLLAKAWVLFKTSNFNDLSEGRRTNGLSDFLNLYINKYQKFKDDAAVSAAEELLADITTD